MVISQLILFFGYLMGLVKLSSRATAFTRLWLRTKPGIVIRKVLGAISRRSAPSRASFYWKVQSMIFETIYVNLCVCFDIWESMFWEVRWMDFFATSDDSVSTSILTYTDH